MSVKKFDVSQGIDEACNIIMNNLNADLVDKTVIPVDGGRSKVITLSYEKYFMRVSNRVGLFIILEDTLGITKIKSVATGASESLFFKFDWGAAKSFGDEVYYIFNN